MIINALLTRHCNLKCSYCKIRQHADQYKEISADEWFDFFNKMYKFTNEDLFVILYGGEPTLYKQFDQLMNKMVNSDIPFTIISNSTEPARKKIEKWIPKLKGLTASVDPYIISKGTDIDILTKSSEGLQFLIEKKKENPNLDCVAEIVVDASTWKYLEELVEVLDKNGIWSSVTIVEYDPTEHYDFGTCLEEQRMRPLEITELQRVLVDLVFVKKYKIHAPEAIFRILADGYMNSKCYYGDANETLTIEPNGHLRCCLRIKGRYSDQITIFDLPEKWEEFKKLNSQDIQEFCKGCSWTCPFMFNVLHD